MTSRGEVPLLGITGSARRDERLSPSVRGRFIPLKTPRHVGVETAGAMFVKAQWAAASEVGFRRE
jgi:hypothetical protein